MSPVAPGRTIAAQPAIPDHGPAKQAAFDRLHEALARIDQPAPCELNPDAWYPANSSSIQAREAVAWCHTCPVEQECREWAHIKPNDTRSGQFTVVLGGEWWTRGRPTNPNPKRGPRRKKQVAA